MVSAFRFQRRQVLRAGYPKGRTEVAEEANRFNMRYALAQASIEGRLGFHPPPRANSVSLGQVVRCRAEETTPDPASHARRASDAQT
ncbi:unnamed protein product [Durusdinium trenchii]|uniref:Uncharacterized protein n=1 Tax=Durusdinium trenchii TaxID=1381693 RepID=A0ABP0QPI7_9DINO